MCQYFGDRRLLYRRNGLGCLQQVLETIGQFINRSLEGGVVVFSGIAVVRIVLVCRQWAGRRDIVQCAKRAFNSGLVAATDGNISVRMSVDRVMITPGGTSFNNLNPGQMAYVDTDGHLLDYSQRPSSELPMHLEIYHLRPEIGAIIHAHPPFTTAFTVAGISLPIAPT